MYHNNRMEIEKQLKNDIGYSITEAEMKLRSIKNKSNELYSLRCSINGFCSETNEKITLTKDDRLIVQVRINELQQ